MVNSAKYNKGEIDWTKMMLGETEQESGDESPGQIISTTKPQGSKMAQIDLMLMKFIEHHQLFEFIDVYKVYLNGWETFLIKHIGHWSKLGIKLT